MIVAWRVWRDAAVHGGLLPEATSPNRSALEACLQSVRRQPSCHVRFAGRRQQRRPNALSTPSPIKSSSQPEIATTAGPHLAAPGRGFSHVRLGVRRLASVSGRLEARERELQVMVDALDEVSAVPRLRLPPTWRSGRGPTPASTQSAMLTATACGPRMRAPRPMSRASHLGRTSGRSARSPPTVGGSDVQRGVARCRSGPCVIWTECRTWGARGICCCYCEAHQVGRLVRHRRASARGRCS
jgi:hypothetical protein